MAMTNQERVGKAMDLLRAGLAPFSSPAPGLLPTGTGSSARWLAG